MDEKELEEIKKKAIEDIENVDNIKTLEKIEKELFAKEGELGRIFASLALLNPSERAIIGVKANALKKELNEIILNRRAMLQSRITEKQTEFLDITLPGAKLNNIGHIHPLTQTIKRVSEIFYGMGFEIFDGPEIENEWYAFDALNIPRDHPTRDSWDTLFLEDKTLLRPHTSPGQIRYMENHQPPLRIILPGRCFRRDSIDASHEINFYQIEGLMVDQNISVANFKAIIEEFFRKFFADSEKDKEKLNCKIRLRPSYFPFTEPSFEVDLWCVHCAGRGCSACKGSGWMEIMGAGMVHPNVLANAGVNSSMWQGFAFGMGLERLAMIKYKINDIRLFYDGGREFLEQF